MTEHEDRRPEHDDPDEERDEEHDEERHEEHPADKADKRAKAIRDEIVEQDVPQPMPDDDKPGYPDPDDYPQHSLSDNQRYDAAMVGVQTPKNDADVAEFLAAIDDHAHRVEAMKLCALMMEATGVEPAMWGDAIVGFGSLQYRYPSGDLSETMAVGFSPSGRRLTVYITEGFERHARTLAKLGPHTTTDDCLYIRGLDTVDQRTLRSLVNQSFHHVNAQTVNA
ncbi:hypothetical protein [Stackebrandtia soli]|uniref:hypothetical protein n=1 Tax=Stackebrandtia soli TaxID=1892856 RepID=UPI0039EA114F